MKLLCAVLIIQGLFLSSSASPAVPFKDPYRTNEEDFLLHLLLDNKKSSDGHLDELEKNTEDEKSQQRSEWLCNDRAQDNEKIKGGIKAYANMTRWYVEIKGQGKHCGGTLLSRRLVLTAAHCFMVPYSHHRSNSKVCHTVNGYSAYLWSEKMNAVEISHIYTPSNYYKARGSNLLTSDVAVAVLSRNLQSKSFLSPICMTEDDVPKYGDVCWAIGGGLTDSNSRPKHLQMKKLKKIARCDFSSKNDQLKKVLCTSGGQDLGDSGGPVVCQRGGSWEITYLAGVMSSIPNSRNGAIVTNMLHGGCYFWLRELLKKEQSLRKCDTSTEYNPEGCNRP